MKVRGCIYHCIYTHTHSSHCPKSLVRTNSSSRKMVSAVYISLILALVVKSSLQICAPSCAGVESGFFVRDPTDCTRYYVCVDVGGGVIVPSSLPVDCTDGYYFNDGHAVPRCDPISDAGADFCSDLCNPCVYQCDTAGQVTPNPTDCNTYYVCLAGGLVLEQQCPGNAPFFDFNTGECTADDTLCYNYCDTCVPHCTEQNEKVPDPLDCHNFYVCNPPNIASFICPHTEIFSRVTLECEADADCIIDC
ncbi:uncharacterized protein [Cherax quadricarinatus]